MKKYLLLFLFVSCSPPETYKDQTQGGESGIKLIVQPETVEEGRSFTVTPVILYADGARTETDFSALEWKLSGDGSAMYDGKNSFTAQHCGVVHISATYNLYSDEISVTVIKGTDYKSLKLSVILYDAKGSDAGKEYITIANISGTDIPLNGVKLSYGANKFIFPDGSVITGNSSVTAAQDRDIFNQEYGHFPDYTGLSGAMRNSGETVLLVSPDGTTLDMIFIEGGCAEFSAPETWGSTTLPAAAEGSSISRNAGADTDSYADWVLL